MLCPSCGHVNLPGADDCVRCQANLAHFDWPTGQTSVERHLLEDPVSNLKPRLPVSVRAQDPLGKALQLMLEEERGALLVVDDAGFLIGILTERDYLIKIVGVIDDYSRLPVSGFMTPNPETVHPDDKVAFALHKMDVGGYRHLPVVEQGKPIGVISVRNVLRYINRLCKEPMAY